MKKTRWAALIGTTIVILSKTLVFGDSTWIGTQDANFNNAANWDNGVPGQNDAAIFSSSGPTAISMTSPVTTVSGLTFNSDASAYTITLSSTTEIDLVHSGITNNSAQTQRIQTAGRLIFEAGTNAGNSDLETGTLINQGNITITEGAPLAVIEFNSATAANSSVGTNGGTINFSGTAQAANASIGLFDSAVLTFNNTSTASSATITSSLDSVIQFNDKSTAGNATINLNSFIAPSTLGFTGFSSASSSTISNVGETVQFGDNSTAAGSQINNVTGTTSFTQNATAGQATITISTIPIRVTDVDVSSLSFVEASNAGQATIINQAASVNFSDIATASSATIMNSNAGSVNFSTAATAGNANIRNTTGGSANFFDVANAGNAKITNFDVDSVIQFNNASNAGNATITNDGSGLIQFNNNSGGGNSSIMNNGGTFSMSNLNSGLTVGSAAGSGIFLLGSQSLTTGGNGSDASISGVISGSGGSLVKVGSGTLTLTGTNTYSGGTTINGGTLNVSDDSNLGDASGNLTLNSGVLQTAAGITTGRTVILETDGGTVDTNGFDSNFTGSIQGNGAFVKAGGGALTLFSMNTYTGDTFINGGVLRAGGNNVFSPTSAIILSDTNGASLDLDGFNETIGSLSGGGLSGGDINLGSGTLTVGGDGSSGSYGGSISGSGDFVKVGSGTLTLTGTNIFTGNAIVDGGYLQLLGSLRGNATILDGASFSNVGSMGSLVNHGTVTPGINGVGTLTVAEYSGPGTLHIVFDKASFNSLVVTGTATLTGGSLNITGTDFTTGDYDILKATAVVGTFDSVATPPLSYFLKMNTVYTPTDVDITIQSLSFSKAAQTGNQASLASALDADKPASAASFATTMAAPAPSSSFSSMIQSLYALTSADQVQNAYNQISGDSLASFQATSLRTAEVFSDQMRSRMVSSDEVTTTALLTPVQLAYNGDLEQATLGLTRIASTETVSSSSSGLWSRGIGFSDQVDGDTSLGSPSSRSTTGGFQGGYDFQAADDVIFGLSGGFAQTSLNVDDRDSSGNSTSIQTGIYASYTPGLWFVNGSMAYVTSSNAMTRNIQFTGINETATSNFTSQVETALVEAGYNLAPRKNFSLQPLVSLRQSHLHQDAFTETGAPGVDLSVQDENTNSLMSAMGARLSREFNANSSHAFTVGARAAWQHELADVDNSITADFADAPASAFSVQATPRSRNAAAIGLDGRVNLSKNLEGFGDYSATLGSDQNTQGLFGGLRLSW